MTPPSDPMSELLQPAIDQSTKLVQSGQFLWIVAPLIFIIVVCNLILLVKKIRKPK